MNIEPEDIVGVDSLQQSCWQLARAYARKLEQAHGFWPDRQLLELAHYLEQDANVQWRFDVGHEYGSAIRFRPRYELANMVGGGIDSFIAFFQANETLPYTSLVNIWVDYGQPYAEKERRALTRLRKATEGAFRFYELKIPSPYTIIEGFDYLFPCRNLLLASLGTVDARRIWISANKRDPSTTQGALDKTPHFFKVATQIFSRYYDTPYHVESPQIKQSKTETIAWYLSKQHLKPEWLFATSTCYDPIVEKCGTCYSCYKRRKAFLALGIEEPGYNVPFDVIPMRAEYEAREQKKGRS